MTKAQALKKAREYSLQYPKGYERHKAYSRMYHRWRNTSKEGLEYKAKWKRDNGYRNEYASRARHPIKFKCRLEFNYAIRRGYIKRGKCEVCGSPNAHGHHENYRKPLEVRWLCRRHHAIEHRKYD